jgi:non-ribosomal peptide synthetase-like protein
VRTEVDRRRFEDLPDAASGTDATAARVLACQGYEHTIRWRRGERLDHLFEDRCDRMRDSDRLAVDTGDTALTYNQLDARANQLARLLLTRGARPGDRIGLLFDDAVHSYVSMLAVLKINSVYVPLDVGFPSDRSSYIVGDAGVGMVLTLSHLRDRLQNAACLHLYIDEIAALVAAEDDHRLTDGERGDPVDELCYIIYTSGSTGRPKGVAVEHASICNFVRVAVEVYGIRPRDRVYQGMTIAFDFSVEEIWVPLVAGATLVPKPVGSILIGHELGEFLRVNEVTALCCVPTLLATLEEDVPGLRFLLVSGEACPQHLIARWHQRGRRFLNVYGPTEATVTATWTLVHPDRSVTIGVPLPTYSVVILDPAECKALLPGEVGEIGIAGIGLARGYLNRDELTDRAFIRDFLGIDNNPSGRIYRTGDLGRVNDDGEIEYHGRLDTQVKIRGYRIELTEIESVLLQVPGVAQAVVGTYEPEPGTVELVAYYSRRRHATVNQEQVYQQLRERLPRYMIPAYLEELAVIPMLPSDKTDRKNLPAPQGSRSLAGRDAYVDPATGTERFLADALASALRLEQVSVDAHFFDDLGADSLLMAQFCARVRKQADLPPVSMTEVYLHPTIRSLATALADQAPGPAGSVIPPSPAAPVRATTAQYLLCGSLQLLVFLGLSYLSALLLVLGYEWTTAGTGLIGAYLRAVLFGGVAFLAACALPIVAKWVLVGRWKSQEFPVWSLTYLRFWLVKTLVRANPMVLFVGSPLYLAYLRALGAKIGRGVAIFSRTIPVCTDLLTVEDGTVIRKDTSFVCYRAHAGWIQTGPITLGRNVVIAEQSVIDIATSMGDGAQLGHASSLHASQAVPAGESWHGSPAQRSTVDYRSVDPTRCSTLRRAIFSALQLLNLLGVVMPLSTAGWGALSQLFDLGGLALASWGSYLQLLVTSLVLFCAGVLAGLVVVVTLPRLLNLLITPGRIYPLYGLRYSLHRTITRVTNTRFYTTLFGDSSYVVHYLQALGYDLSRVEQTGSNFGLSQRHETPYLCTIGTGTMVSDGLSMINANFSSTSFTVTRTTVGARSFLGNNIVYPSNSRMGDNCLYGTKVMVPIDGKVRVGIGLLGSPPFEIPRSVHRDHKLDHLRTGEEFRCRLAAKNRHNIATLGIFLLVRWFHFYLVTVLALLAAGLYDRIGAPATAADVIVTVLVSIGYFMFVERAGVAFRTLSPQFCSIYDPYYWWHERFWKLSVVGLGLLNGTPFKNLAWRLLGVRIGHRVFDDGCAIVERTLVTLGDDCTLAAGSTIQSHSLEDGIFKSDHTTLGAGCTIGTSAFVHYGVTIGEGALIDADAFLMKGTEVAPHTRWRGNPAHEIPEAAPVGPTALPVPVTPTPTTQAASVSVAASLLERQQATGPIAVLATGCPQRNSELIKFLGAGEAATIRAQSRAEHGDA